MLLRALFAVLVIGLLCHVGLAEKPSGNGSKLGIRNMIVPKMVGTGTYLFYFEAKHKGSGTAIVVIDDVKYEYRFEVAPEDK